MNPYVLLLIFLSLMISGEIPSTLAAQPKEVQSLVNGNTAFGLDLYGKLQRTPGNIFFSPYSISSCLAMAYAGARGNTESQMAKVLHFGADQQQLHSAFGTLQRQLVETAKQAGLELNIANALWAQQDHPFLPGFVGIAKDQYQANVNQADFKTSANTVIEQINRWVEQQTKDKIQNILPPNSLDAQTRLVLANAIYFKGVWEKKFDSTQTSTQPFHLLDHSRVEVPLMHRAADARYMEEGDFQAVELPYSTNEFSMVILLPRQAEGCHPLETRLSPALLSKTIAQMKNQKVEIFLPRFKLQLGCELNAPLVSLGMADAFGPKADFSGMDGTHLLNISAIFHKAWGEVNEEGTEAAAATVAGIRASAVIRPITAPPVFRADHPFIFFIRDSRSGALLFLGRLENPVNG